MLGYYKYSRKQIVKMIKKSPRTNDGYYYMPNFSFYNNKKGTINGENDRIYNYKRDLFNNMICFNNDDIECYIAPKDENNNYNYDIKKMNDINERLKNVIGEFKNLNLNDIIENKKYNLNELIDTSIFVFNNKYY